MTKWMKWLWRVAYILAGVGGLAWLLAGLGIDLISVFGSFARFVEIVAGVSGISVALRYFLK